MSAIAASKDSLEELARKIHEVGGRPSALPVRQSFSIVGTFRLSFNRHGAAPLVWSIATDHFELAVASFELDAPTRPVYQPKATPDDEDGKPSAWLEVTGVLTVDGQLVRFTRQITNP